MTTTPSPPSSNIELVESIEKKLEAGFQKARPKLAYGMLKGKVEGVDKTFALTKLPVCLGRSSSSSTSASPPTKKDDKNTTVITVGTTKSISRQHVLIKWLPQDAQFEVTCLGKNGMVIDGDTVLAEGKSHLLSCDRATPIRFGSADLYFLPALAPDLPVSSGRELVAQAFVGVGASAEGLSINNACERIVKKYPDYLDAVGGDSNVRRLVKQYFESKNHFLFIPVVNDKSKASEEVLYQMQYGLSVPDYATAPPNNTAPIVPEVISLVE